MVQRHHFRDGRVPCLALSCCDKRLTKERGGGKGLFDLQVNSPSLREAQEGTRGRN